MKKREIQYSEAIREATELLMRKYPQVYVLGEGVDDFTGVWGTTKGLVDIFGQERVVDIPLSENALTGISIGTALLGYRPIFTHQRMDFMLMCMDALFNHASKWFYMTGLRKRVPLTVRAIIGKGWGQSCQHAQSFYPIFAHFPGVKIVAPYTPYEAKGVLVSAVLDDDPVIIVEARSLYSKKGPVPKGLYKVPLGRAEIIRSGRDLTIVGVSYILDDILEAAESLRKEGVSAEVINLRSIKPLDMERIIKSVKKTRNIVIVDISWEYCSMASEVASRVSERLFQSLQRPPLKITLPDGYVGASETLEKKYYLSKEKILKKIKKWLKN